MVKLLHQQLGKQKKNRIFYQYINTMEMKSPESQFSSLIQFKFDFSLLQHGLTHALSGLAAKIRKLEVDAGNMEQKFGQEIVHVHNTLCQETQKNGIAFENLKARMSVIEGKNSHPCTTKSISFPNAGSQSLRMIEKTPTQVLNHIQQRLSQPRKSIVDLNYSPPRADPVCFTVKVSETDNEHSSEDKSKGENPNSIQQIDRKCFKMYARIMEVLQKQITSARNELKLQIKELKGKSHKFIEQCQKKLFLEEIQRISSAQKEECPAASTPNNHSQEKQPSNSSNTEELGLSIANLESLITKLREQVTEIQAGNCEKIEEITKTNSLMADHILENKKSIEELTNQTDALKMEMSGFREKSSGNERQLALLVDCNNDNKNKIKFLETSIAKLYEELRDDGTKQNNRETIQEEVNEEEQGQKENSNASSRKDILRDSHSSFRSSMNNINQLNPLRHNSILKQSNTRIQAVEQNMKKVTAKLGILVDKFNKMQDERRRLGIGGQSGMLPKIDKQNKSNNVNHLQIVRKDIKKVNEQLCKTNEKLNATKDRLNQLYALHAEIPNKIEDLYVKLREYNQLQQDRLIELIKQLINRALTDPFDNNFTNRLKREINVKFLEIKHEYNCILKQIESKVEGRAQKTELAKVVLQLEQNILEAKTLCGKKCDVEDFKKGVKYLENKIKEVFNYAKSQTVALHNEQKQYIGVKKQNLH